MASSRKPILLKALWHETKQSQGIWALACHLQLASSRFSPRASLKSPQCFPNIPTVFQTISTILWVPLNRYKQNCSWEVQSLLISFLIHKASVGRGDGGGRGFTEEWAFKGHKAPWLRNPSLPKCSHPEQILPCVLSKEVKGMGCTARPGLRSTPGPLYPLCMASWQMTTPPMPVSMLGTSSSSKQLACAQRQLELTMILNKRTLSTTYCHFFSISL